MLRRIRLIKPDFYKLKNTQADQPAKRKIMIFAIINITGLENQCLRKNLGLKHFARINNNITLVPWKTGYIYTGIHMYIIICKNHNIFYPVHLPRRFSSRLHRRRRSPPRQPRP